MHYIYFRISEFYKNVIGESDPKLYAFFVITTIQSVYLIGFLNIAFHLIDNTTKILSFLEMALIFSALLALNFYVLFSKKSDLEQRIKRWKNESDSSRKINGLFVSLFLILGAILFGVSVVWF